MRELKPTHQTLTIDDIREGLRREKDAKVARRMQAIVWRLEGREVGEVVKLLHTGRASLSRWVKAFNTEGLAGLRTRRGAGPKSRLSAKHKEQLKGVLLRSESLRQNPPPEGYGNQWRGKTLQLRSESLRHYLRQELGVCYQKSEIYRLFDELGFSLQRPRRRYVDADADKVAEFEQTLSGEKRTPKSRRKTGA